MSIRTTRTYVTFQQPFTIAEVDGVQPRGTYAVETDEEEIEGLSFLAFRRIATTLFLPAVPSFPRQTVKIDPLEFAATHARDPEGMPRAAAQS